MIEPRIAEEDAADLTRMSLDEISMHSPLPEHLSDDEKVLDIGIARRISRYNPRDSIASVDMNEIPLLRDDEKDVVVGIRAQNAEAGGIVPECRLQPRSNTRPDRAGFGHGKLSALR